MNETTTERIIDWTMLMDICGYENMVEKIVKLSAKDAGQTSKLLTKAIKCSESKDIALYAHRLKGIAMTIGAVQLSEKTYLLECAGNEKNIDDPPLLFNDVKVELTKVLDFLSRADWMEMAKQQASEQLEKELVG